jgi:Putative adhesin
MFTMEKSATTPPTETTTTKKWRPRTKVLIVAGAGVAAFGAAIAVDLAMAGTSHASAQFNQPIVRVDADIDSGSLRIVGSNDPKITIESTVHSGIRGPSHSETVVGDRLVVRSNCPFDLITTTCSVDYIIHVPNHVAVKARGNGSDFDLTAVHGDVDVSVNGGQVDMSFDAAPHHVKAEANGGHINITVPDDNAGYRVDTHTNGGSTNVGIRTDPASERTIAVETNGGDIDVRYPAEGGA